MPSIKLMDLNIWNYNAPWPRRRDLIVAELKREQPDVICLQETRSDFRHNEGGRNQARQFAERLGCHYVYQRGMLYCPPPLRVEEGVSILSRHPILEWNSRPLPRTSDPADRHQRVLLRATIATPLGPMRFFCTHWSLAERTRLEQAPVVWGAVSAVRGDLPTFLCGDFNATPDSREIRFLTGRAELNGRSGDLVDVWQALRPGEAGSTFPLPDGGGVRIDYVFAVAGRDDPARWLRSIDLAFTAMDESGVRASDHFGLRVIISPPDGGND